MIYTIKTGPLETNTYIYKKDEKALIIDPAGSGDELLDLIKKENLTVLGIIATHGHLDHVAGVKHLMDTFPDSFFAIHKKESGKTGIGSETRHKQEFKSFMDIFQYFWSYAGPIPEADTILNDKDTLEHFDLEVIHTPGHSPGGICLYSSSDQILFSGDTLFCQSIGRTDLEGGNYQELISSIKTKLLCLPDQTRIFPGHGSPSRLEEEKVMNPFLS